MRRRPSDMFSFSEAFSLAPGIYPQTNLFVRN
jgi:hypothetical protein